MLFGEETRGRCIAFSSLSWQAGPMIGDEAHDLDLEIEGLVMFPDADAKLT